MNKERLLALADFLDQLPPERFDFGRWVGADWKGAPDLSCGTTACAIGWAPQVPMLKAAGIKAVAVAVPYLLGGPPAFRIQLPGEHITYSLAGAARVIFDLDWDGVDRLFYPNETTGDPNGLSRSATAKEVAANIRRFVNEKENS